MNTKHEKLIECIPNISEGRNEFILAEIADIISGYADVVLLHQDTSYDANRTVFTLVGEPLAVMTCMYHVYAYCSKKINMQEHTGTHPRIGAIDVCPFVALKGISEGDLIPMVKTFAEKVTRDFEIPGYLYELSALAENRKNLADIRSGQYEKLSEKLLLEEWKTDVGSVIFNASFGATVIGVRKYLLAYNINLNTENVEIAQKIAREIRTSGYITIDAEGNKFRKKGMLPAVKALGWYMDEYEMAQVSTNIVDIGQITMAEVYEACAEVGKMYDVLPTGSELIGLVPLQAMLDAGRYYDKSPNLDNDKLIEIAIKKLDLDRTEPFLPQKRILEFLLEEKIYNED
jgi:glutamate formiminotransferase/formiminotetrahydrofolate cyclodeaminase